MGKVRAELAKIAEAWASVVALGGEKNRPFLKAMFVELSEASLAQIDKDALATVRHGKRITDSPEFHPFSISVRKLTSRVAR